MGQIVLTAAIPIYTRIEAIYEFLCAGKDYSAVRGECMVAWLTHVSRPTRKTSGKKVRLWEGNWLGSSNLATNFGLYIELLMKKEKL